MRSAASWRSARTSGSSRRSPRCGAPWRSRSCSASRSHSSPPTCSRARSPARFVGWRSRRGAYRMATTASRSTCGRPMMSASQAASTAPLRAARPSRESGDALLPGTVFANRYEVKELLGTGGMGVVYRAFDRELQEPVAIKTLRPEALGGDGVALERFKQEIRLARKITHRNVVRTYDLGEIGGTYYLTMEYVEGTSLKQLIVTRGRLPVPVVLTIGKQLCRALEVAHEQGVIHRDIKPQNMVVDPTGFLKVMDFGIARLATPATGKGLTQEGMSIGTPDYMSPEQLSGLELDARSDLYSAGVVLFECLTARVPFEAASVYALIAKHLEQSPPDPRTGIRVRLRCTMPWRR